MATRPCKPDADVKRIWQWLLPDAPLPACGTAEDADERATPPGAAHAGISRGGTLILELWDETYAVGGAFASADRYPYLRFRADLADLTHEEVSIVLLLKQAHDRGFISDETYFHAGSRMLLARGVGVLTLLDETEMRAQPKLADDASGHPERLRRREAHRAIHERVITNIGDSRSTIAEALDLLRASLSAQPDGAAGKLELLKDLEAARRK